MKVRMKSSYMALTGGIRIMEALKTIYTLYGILPPFLNIILSNRLQTAIWKRRWLI